MSANLILSYDRDADVLEVRFEKPRPSYGEEISEGIFLIRGMDDNKVIGLTVVDFSLKQKNQGLKLPIPCSINEEALAKLQAA